LTYPSGRHGKDVIGKTHTYYQTLIDAKDVPHIVSIWWWWFYFYH